MSNNDISRLSDEEKEFLADQFFVFWDDEPKDDNQMIKEIVAISSIQFLTKSLGLLRKFIESSEDTQVKAEFIKDNVYLRFPNEGKEPMQWLNNIIYELEQATNLG